MVLLLQLVMEKLIMRLGVRIIAVYQLGVYLEENSIQRNLISLLKYKIA